MLEVHKCFAETFRWRYASNVVNFSEADNHDNEDAQEFREWENLALDEAYRYSGM